jgi:hypothetical protein
MIKLLLLAFAVSPLTLLAAAGRTLAETAPTGRDFGCRVSRHGQHHQGFCNWVGSMPC